VAQGKDQGTESLSARNRILGSMAAATAVAIACLLLTAFVPVVWWLWLVLGAGTLLAALALVVAATGQVLQRRGEAMETIRSHIQEIESADTRALELTLNMLSAIQDGAAEASNAAGIMNVLEDNTRAIATTSEQMSSNVNVVATAAEEISANINSTANTAEEISSNMSAVATTVEQMSSNFATVATKLR